MRGLFKKLLLTLLMIALAQCGGKKSRSASATLWEVLPEEPIVILGPTTVNGSEVQGPWFGFMLQMKNTDTDPITILAIELEISGTLDDGTAFAKTASLVPSDFNWSYKSGDDEIMCEYLSFGTFAHNETSVLKLPNSNTNCVKSPYFVIGDMGKKEVGASYRYKVKTRPVGWFGEFTDPTDRFDMSFTFNTK